METYNWGVIGCGWIASIFAEALNQAENACLKAGASRDKKKADEFCSKFGFEKSYGSYQELVEDPEVDIIYVATPHSHHYEQTKLSLEHGKHVLCEKAFTVNYAQAKELVDIATEKKLFLMEAMWTRFLPINCKLRELLRNEAIGKPITLTASIGFPARKEQQRLFDPALAGGALLDIGIYPISYADMVFCREPESIVSAAYLGETGVDESSCYTIDYGKGCFANLTASLQSVAQGDAIISGNNGYIRIPSFIKPQKMYINKLNAEEECVEIPTTGSPYFFQAEHVMQCLDQGLIDSPVMPLEQSLRIMKTMDTMRTQWGLRYPGE